MKFKEFNKQLAENVTYKDFITKVKGYSSIDDALLHLSDEYTEWYLLNINNKILNKELKKLKLEETEKTKETELTEDDLTLGYAPQPKKITKNIKYKGQYITVSYDPDLGTWFPTIRFRSISTALKYIKAHVDYNSKNI